MYMAEMDAKCLAGYIKEGGTDVTMKHIVRDLSDCHSDDDFTVLAAIALERLRLKVV
jgi:hypothetical protein